MGQRHDQAERPSVAVAGEIEQLLTDREHHLVVEIELIGADARAGVQDRTHRVVPAQPLFGMIPIRRPAEIGGIDVGGQTLLETVQLVSAAEMHLARKDGAIAGMAEIMGESRNVGGEFGGVVIGADGRGQTPGHQGIARGRAQRAVAVGGIEHHPLPGQRVHMGRPGDPVAVGRQGAGGQLVGHQDQDIGLGHRYWLLSAAYGTCQACRPLPGA
jgi:hypothetical protein